MSAWCPRRRLQWRAPPVDTVLVLPRAEVNAIRGLSRGGLVPQAEIAVAGRVMARRFMGKLAFMSLVDDSGSIQVYLDKAVVDGSSGEDAFKCALHSRPK